MVFKPKKKKFEEELEEQLEEDDEDEEELEVPKPLPISKSLPSKELPKKKEDDSLEWSVEEITTQTQPIIYNSKEKKGYTLMEAIAELLNRTE